MIKEIFKAIFKNKWEDIYSTQDVEQYAKIKQKLMNGNIEVRTKINNRNVGTLGMVNPINEKWMTTYTILVKTEDAHKVNDILHHKK